MEKNILKHSSFLLIIQIFLKIVSFFYTLFLAKNLGVEHFGLFTVALSYFSLLSAVSEFGINRYIIREIVLDKTRTSSLLCVMTMLRLCLVSIVFAAFAFILFQLDPNKLRVALSLLAVMALIPQAIAFSLDSVLVAFHKIPFSSIGLLILNLSTAVIGFIMVSSGIGVHGAVAAVFLGNILYVFALLLILIKNGLNYLKNYGHKRERVVTFQMLRKVALGSLPYGLLGILGLVYFKIDSILLSYMRGSFEAGIYGIAYRFLEAIVFVPSALSTVLFPVLAKLHDTNIYQLRKLYWKSFYTLFSISLVIFLAYFFILPFIIRYYLPQYSESLVALRLLSFTIPFMFIHIPGATVLLSTDKYLKPVIYLSIITVSFNILSNLILIPEFGYLGASYVTVLSEVISFFVFFIYLQIIFRKM